MSDRHLPVRPNLDQLKHQAKDLFRQIRHSDPAAIVELRKHHPESVEPGDAKLADGQLALARSYGVASWPRLVLACRMIDAIWRDDVDAVRTLVLKHRPLLHEMTHGTPTMPLWAADVLCRESRAKRDRRAAPRARRNRLAARLRPGGLGKASSIPPASCTRMGARPKSDSVMIHAENQNGRAWRSLLELGATISDADGDQLAPVALVLETYARNPRGKHQCLELFAQQGIHLPDTPPMAVIAAESICSKTTCFATPICSSDLLASGDLSARAGVSCR